MNLQQIPLVRSTFALVQPIASDAAALFYDNLFRADPNLRYLFKGDMTHQGQRLMGMIGSALQLLDRPAALLPVLRSLGARHAGYRVREEHYDTVGCGADPHPRAGPRRGLHRRGARRLGRALRRDRPHHAGRRARAGAGAA